MKIKPLNSGVDITKWDSFLNLRKKNLALLFTNEGIVVKKDAKEQLFCLHPAINKLCATIEILHFLEDIVVLKCETDIVDQESTDPEFQIIPVKQYLHAAAKPLQALILKSYHWIQWDIQSQFCGKCGGVLEVLIQSTEKSCSACKDQLFPRFSPAIVVLVRRGNKILLARSPHFPPNVYSAIAGFVDIGETAEMTVQREIQEEVGLEVKNIKYIDSQTWPFPDSLMLAFEADYLSGEIKLDKNEIEDAAWFEIDSLPKLPGTASIARQLIDRTSNIIKNSFGD